MAASQGSAPNSHTQSDRPAALLYAAYWLLLGAFVLAFVVHAGPAVLWLVAMLIIGVTIALYTRTPLLALCTLPGTLMLGVIVRLPLGSAGVTFGDVHLFVVTLMFLATRPNGKIFVGKAGLAPLVVVLITLSWLFSVDLAGSTITMFGLAELFLVYLLTLNLLKGEEDGAALLRAWSGTITLCSALIIVSYLRNEPLILGGVEEIVRNFGELKATGRFFIRASFFVTGFNYPLACTLVMLVVSLLLGRSSLTGRLLLFGALVINCVAAVLLGNKSVIFGVAISSLLAVAYLARYKRVWLRLAVVVAGSIIVTKISLLFIERVITAQQLLLFLERINNPDSFIARLETWRSVAAAVLSSPHALLIGLGPDVSTRGDNYLFVPILGNEHGVDSQYFFILLNYGLVILLLYLRYFVTAFRLLLGKMTGNHRLTAALILGSMLAWLMVGIGQQAGAAKSVAVGVQLAAIIELLRARRYEAGPRQSVTSSRP